MFYEVLKRGLEGICCGKVCTNVQKKCEATGNLTCGAKEDRGMPDRTERLTRREREIMNAIFALGNRASADQIRSRLTNPPSGSSVRVMLARLERKGCVKHH